MLDASLFPIMLASFPLWMLVMTAVWARSPQRRSDARRVLRIVMRRPEPGQG